MSSYIIKVEDYLTPHIFYNYLLPQLHKYYKIGNNENLIFDFSEVKAIEPLVIPNLLCIGYIININSNKIPYIYISEHSDKLKRYLYDIKFTHIAKTFNIFRFSDTIEAGLSEKISINPNCGTIYLNESDSELKSWNLIVDNFKYYEKFFLHELGYSYIANDGNKYYQNFVFKTIDTIVENAKIHGKSFAICTLQYNYKRQMNYISCSDCGVGFLNTINSKKSKNLDRKYIFKGPCENELEAILEGLFFRFEEPLYGLYHTATKVLELGGSIHIHSMNTQLRLRDLGLLESLRSLRSDEYKIKSFINDNTFIRNVRTDLKFGGVHIEIMVPLDKNKIRGPEDV